MKTIFYWKVHKNLLQNELWEVQNQDVGAFDEDMVSALSNAARQEYDLQSEEVRTVLDEIFVIERQINQLLKLKAFW